MLDKKPDGRSAQAGCAGKRPGPVSRLRRSASRFLASLPADLHHDGRDYPCAAYDLSRKGVLLIGAIPALESPETQLTVRSSGSGDLELSITGRVTRVVDDPKGQEIQVGIEFPALSSSDHTVLESLVARVVDLNL